MNHAKYEWTDADDGEMSDAVISAKFKAAITPPQNLKARLLAQKHEARFVSRSRSPLAEPSEKAIISLLS